MGEKRTFIVDLPVSVQVIFAKDIGSLFIRDLVAWQPSTTSETSVRVKESGAAHLECAQYASVPTCRCIRRY